MPRWLSTIVLVVGFSLAAKSAQTGEEANLAEAPAFDAAAIEFFETQVRPILVENCQRCHGPDKQEGSLRLDRRDTIVAGGDSGAAIEPGDPDASLLIQAVRYGPDGYQMPPPGRLPDAQVAALEEWVRRGAPWPAEAPAAPDPKAKFDLAERAKHWSFQPVKPQAPPEVRDSAWPQTPIDAFILAELERQGLAPAGQVDRSRLLRRLSFDLIVLPPTPEEIDAFVADTSPRALETVVDRLLASPRYGERWARHWLDLVRYAEGHGHEFDFEIPYAFQYRDYVIRALNADVPYDQFVREHVAGDMLVQPRRHPTKGFNESILGTGFFHLGEATHSPVDILGDEAERFDNQIDVLGKAFLGLTIACARCHDHKFDAISNKDYYALAGILHSSRYQVASFDGPQHNVETLAEIERLSAEREKLLRQLTTARLSAGLPQLGDFLRAASELLTKISPEDDPTGRAETLALAEARRLDAARLAGWVQRLRAAGPADVLYLWARLGSMAAGEFATARAALASQLDAAAAPPGNWRWFADFDEPDYAGWIVGNEAFAGQPRQATAVFATAQNDALRPTGGGSGVADSARLAVRLRGALRSPTFTIEHQHIWLRLRGTGTVAVVVDSHRLLHGPLHGSTRARVDQQAGYAWVALNVADYRGHNAYIELVDEGPDALAVDCIGFGDAGPPADRLPSAIAALLHNDQIASADELATSYERVFAEALTDYGAERGSAELDWLLANADLIAGPDTDAADVESRLAASRARQAELEAQLVAPRLAMAMADGSPEECYVYIRGNPHKRGEYVPRRFLEAIAGADQPPLTAECGRLDLAQRLTDPANPLPARVIVNRLWQHHFGRGIVATPDNFGRMGEPPTNQPLLDWLAAELIRSGWSLKALHRLMVTSRVYALDSQPVAESLAADPKNLLWHYRPLARLEAEPIRDAILAVSGRLDTAMYGPSVPVYLTEFMTGRGRPTESGPLDGAGRRSVYLSVRRNFLPELLVAFDFPPPFTCVGQRASSNVPAQALLLLNNPFVIEQARTWAERMLVECPGEADVRIERMYRMALGRPPEIDELTAAREFVAARAALITSDPVRPWAELGHVLFNVKEFIYVR